MRKVAGVTIRPGGLALTDHAVKLCGLPRGARVLDVGCGAGATVEHLGDRYGFEAMGVDPSVRLLAEGMKRNPSLSLSVGEAESLRVEDDTLDGIFCECVMSVLTNPRRALVEFHRALRGGGYLILTDLYQRTPSRSGRDAMQRPACGKGAAMREDLVAWLSASGFRLLVWEDQTHLLKELAARLILMAGTLEGLGLPGMSCDERPGYYLAIARKV